MTTTKESPGQKPKAGQNFKKPTTFRGQLLRLSALMVGGAAVGVTLIVIGSGLQGIPRWVLLIAGGGILVGLALFTSALSGETRRKLGPLPLGKPDEDLNSLPFYHPKNPHRGRDLRHGRNLPTTSPETLPRTPGQRAN